MTREDLLKSPEYWISGIQIDLYNCAERFMEEKGMNRTQLAEHLNCSKAYVSQLLNGDYDHKLSKLVELSLAFGYVPRMNFVSIDDVVARDSSSNKLNVVYKDSSLRQNTKSKTDDWECQSPTNKEAA